ncbi:hydantoinase B/oxoprolinase family protein [Maribacter sp.]|nr:hydantoinase B/oxoprolinase family protein [Maribacter sp.]
MQQTATTFDPIALSILWSRLISIVDEAGTTLQRTSFSTVTRESNDFAVVLMDRKGRSIAQSSVSVPSFLGVLPILTKALLKDYFPVDTWKEGDVVMTNDPWLCAGHKPDIGIVSPIFYEGKLIGFIGTIAHSPDMGGQLWGAGTRDLYEEGLMVPPTKLMSEGKPNDTLFNILEHNVRAAEQTVGDIRAQVAANDQGIKSLMKLMEENDLEDLQALSDAVINASEKAMREALLAAPDGSYQYEYDTDGDGRGVGCHFEITITIKGDEIVADYTGTSGAHYMSINAVLNYTFAYTAYPIKCAFSPDVPNNDGSFYPITVTAPKGCLVNAQKPVPLGARNVTGNMLHSVVFGALAKAVPTQVQADCGSACWCIVLNGEHKGKEFVEYFFLNGGYGARPTMDGEHVLSFPTNVANVPIEVLETDVAVLVTEKSLLPNSAGNGEFRGGLGQRFSFKNIGEKSINVSMVAEKTKTASKGILGGEDGQMGSVEIVPKREFPSKGLGKLHPGEELILTLPGGAGYGNPANRDKEAIEEDRILGYIS